MGIFWEAWDRLERYFYGDLPTPRERVYGAIRGSLETLDPYTIFLEPQPSAVEQDRLSGAYGGIGVDVWRNNEGNVFLSPYPDSPAEAAGVEPHDQLLSVDNRPVVTATLDTIRVWMRGEVGTSVDLTLQRPAPPTPFELSIVREEIRIPSVTYRVLDRDPSIGYVRISGFTERTLEETEEALGALLDAPVDHLVLDLRNNGGGLISPAVSVTDLFLDDGLIMRELSQGDEETLFEAHSGGLAADVPLVVLVNPSTASAAEIVAGAIQAHERAPLIGQRTYGKGSVQLIFALSDGSALHVTSAVWLLPGDQPVEPDGLAPDIVVQPVDGIEDAQLERAIQYLQSGE
jgi:carboxyl-terminal processing protease